MRKLCSSLALCAALALHAQSGHAAGQEVQIHLLLMGPGDHLYTRGGHAALMVAEVENGSLARSTVYNFGDTDWNNSHMLPDYLRGRLVFFLSDTGELLSTLEEYGVNQGREVTTQRLNLTPDQAAEIARRLREGTEPGKREYNFHHVHAVCSSRILDLLDDVLDGKLRAELAHTPGPSTVRHYQDLVLGESVFLPPAGDLLFGRLHDQVLDKYASAAWPEHMRADLQNIMVPAPSGENRLVPLAEQPELLVQRKEPLVLHKSWFSRALWPVLGLLLLGFGARAHRRAADEPEQAAGVVQWAALSSGVVGLLLLALMLFTTVPELRENELILSFWPTDLWLAWRMRAIARNGAAPDAWTRRYTVARLTVAGLVVVGHLTGVLYQQPRILAGLGCAVALTAWALTRALSRRALPVQSQSQSAPQAVAEA